MGEVLSQEFLGQLWHSDFGSRFTSRIALGNRLTRSHLENQSTLMVPSHSERQDTWLSAPGKWLAPLPGSGSDFQGSSKDVILGYTGQPWQERTWPSSAQM